MAPVVPLITCDEDGKYKVCEETLSWIASHDRPFGVVACAGKYRTGKSFLMNVLTNANPGFGVGHTVNRCTRGLWVCKHFFKSGEDADKDVLFVDTEGIGAVDADDDTDVRIMTYVLLLCTCFVYNSVGAIDEGALATLSFMTRTAEQIKSETLDSETRVFPPTFVWLMRDWDLRLEDEKGNPISPDQYLERALASTNSGGQAGRDATRETLRDFFPTRACRQMSRPSEHCGQLDARSGRGISASFRSKTTSFRTELLESLVPPFRHGDAGSVGGWFVGGAGYAELCRAVVGQGGGDKLPTMMDAWNALQANKNREVFETACSGVEEELKTIQLVTDEVASRLARTAEEQVMKRSRPSPTQETWTELSRRVEGAIAVRRTEVALDVVRRVTAHVGKVDAVLSASHVHHAGDEDASTKAIEEMRSASQSVVDVLAPHVNALPVVSFHASVVKWFSWLQKTLQQSQEVRAAAVPSVVEEMETYKRKSEALQSELDETRAQMASLTGASLERASKAFDRRPDDEAGGEKEGGRREDEPYARDENDEEAHFSSSASDDAVLAKLVEECTSAAVRAKSLTLKLTAAETEMDGMEAALVQSEVSRLSSMGAATDRIRSVEKRAHDSDAAWVAKLDGVTSEMDAERRDRDKEAAVYDSKIASLQTVLEEWKQRDSDVRREWKSEVTDLMTERSERDKVFHEERLKMHVACAQATEALETRNADLREMKRARDTTDELRSECKRLRVEAIVRHGELCRVDCDAAHSSMQARNARQETEMLRRSLNNAQRRADRAAVG